VASEPGAHLLVGDDFGVHVPAEAKRHDENPGLDPLAGKDIDDDRSLAKIDLGSFSGGKIQDAGGLRVLIGDLFGQPVHGAVAGAKTELIDQRALNGGQPDPLCHPLCDSFLVIKAQ